MIQKFNISLITVTREKIFRWSGRMSIEILKDVISASVVIMKKLEKVSKYQLSVGGGMIIL